MSTGSVRALGLRVRQLEHEVEIARRLAGFDDGGPARERRYRFIATVTGNFPVTSLCRVCGVSRSAFYAWLRRQAGGPDEGTRDEAILANRLYDLWRRSRRRYGAPRLHAALAREGTRVSEKRLASLMAALGISVQVREAQAQDDAPGQDQDAVCGPRRTPLQRLCPR